MKRRFLNVLLAAVMVVTSLDMTAYAAKAENTGEVWTQEEEFETTEEAEQTIWTEEISMTENVEFLEEGETTEEIHLETVTESTDEPVSETISTKVQEETTEIEQDKETDELQEENGGESNNDIFVGETQEQETEEEIKSSEEEETQTEETETADVAANYERISRVSRDDGTWLFPLNKAYWNSFSDWAGCPGYSKCSFCGKVHSSWGDDAHTGQSYGHNGFDIGTPIGTSVLAAATGTVAYTSIGNNGGRGNFIVIEHPISGIDFSYYSYYQHLNSISVTKGASVKAGDTIAKSGNSGIGTGAHLHFGIVIAQKGTNIGSRLGQIENKGWVTGSENKEGRILVNPSTKQQDMPTGNSAVIPPLAYHSGSVMYTFDKSKVTIGPASPAASTLKITWQSAPENLKVGSYWTCTGTITSNYTINEVGGYILGSDNSTVLYSKVINPNATSYSLENGAIDKALLFNKLSEGTYYYKITAKDTSGKSLTLINEKFTVGNPAPAPVPCNFSGQITSPADWAEFNTSNVKITASATDTSAISSFTIKLWFNGVNEKTETVAAYQSGNAYIGNCDFNLSNQGVYAVDITATCQNGGVHSVGLRYFSYDTTPPIISDLRAYEDNGDFYCSANVNDDITSDVKSWFVIKDERGSEKRFECTNNNNIFCGIWSDVNGLQLFGKYTITFYAQDKAGNIGHATLQDIVIAEAFNTYDGKVYMTVGEEKEVDIQIDTLFMTEAIEYTEKTDKGMKATIKASVPGWSMFKFTWIGKNNAFSTTPYGYDIFVYVVPQAPKITKISGKIEDYDVITYEPVPYSKTYELYCKRVGIDADYQLYEEFTDSKSHSVIVEHPDKDVVYCYRLRAKAEETLDGCTGEKYYPTSDFSNEVYSEERGETEESSSTEESSTEEGNSTEESSTEESSTDEESSTEDDSFSGDGDITEGLYISGLKAKMYTGSAVKQELQLYYNKTLLQEGTDYTLSYKNNVNAGKALLTIKAKGNLTGTVTKTFEIEPREITDGDVIIEDTVYIYDNKVHKKAPKVTYKGNVLRENKDYKVVSYGTGDYVSAGTYFVEIKGIGNFNGSFDNAKVMIVDKSKNISKASIAKIPDQEYQNGAKVELADELINVTLARTELKKGTDYIVSYANNINPGKATLVIKGTGEYAGTKKVTFRIKRIPTAITDSMVVNQSSMDSVEITKGGATPEPVLMLNGYQLIKGIDYTVSYKNNKKADSNASIIIKGKGNYNGSVTLPFTIKAKTIDSPDITIRVPDMPYMGKANKYQSKPILTDKDGKMLVANKDYTIESYSVNGEILDKRSNPEENTIITVKIKGKGSYIGETKVDYVLKGIKFSSANIKISDKSYTGNAVTIGEKDISSATIKTGKGNKALTLGKDYEIVSYQNNIKKGIAIVVFKGKGEYSGEKTVRFKIKSGSITGKQ